MASFRLGDVPVNNLAAAGLPVPSVIRAAKIVTIEASAARLGKVTRALFKQVAKRLRKELGFGSAVD